MASPLPPTRKHVTLPEAKSLFEAAAHAGRQPVRDRALIMAMYYHGLRVAEATAWQWSDIDWPNERVHVARVKNGIPSTHPINGAMLRQLRALKRESEDHNGHVFRSERGGPMSADSVARIVERAGVIAGLGQHAHPHMLRHGCGFYLANRGTDTRTIQAYLGHARITSTVVYTALDANRFKGLFRDAA